MKAFGRMNRKQSYRNQCNPGLSRTWHIDCWIALTMTTKWYHCLNPVIRVGNGTESNHQRMIHYLPLQVSQPQRESTDDSAEM